MDKINETCFLMHIRPLRGVRCLLGSWNNDQRNETGKNQEDKKYPK